MLTSIGMVKKNILLRAKRNYLLKSGAVLFEELPNNIQGSIKDVSKPLDKEEFLIALYCNQCKWTVVSTHRVFSFHEKVLFSIELNKMKPEIILLASVNENYTLSIDDLKNVGEYLKLDEKTYIWAPAGATIFALWNLLLMFKQ